MPRLILIAAPVLAVLALAACGADGEPQPPVKPGLTVSGEARIGVVVK